MAFLDTFKHLLPRARAWSLIVDKKLRSFFEGLTRGPEDARAFVDDVHDDLYPALTRALPEWEEEFGLPTAITEEARRANIDAAWKATGGQSPRYLQDIVQAAGFPLFVHEWYSSGPPFVQRDPHDYTVDPLIGTVQCGEPLAQCGEPLALCNNFLANFPRYYVNLDLTRRPPPPIPPDGPTKPWHFFLYFGAETLGPLVVIPSVRRAELEELLLRICPAQQWIVLTVAWVDTRGRITLQGDRRVTLQGDHRIAHDGLTP